MNSTPGPSVGKKKNKGKKQRKKNKKKGGAGKFQNANNLGPKCTLNVSSDFVI